MNRRNRSKKRFIPIKPFIANSYWITYNPTEEELKEIENPFEINKN